LWRAPSCTQRHGPQDAYTCTRLADLQERVTDAVLELVGIIINAIQANLGSHGFQRDGIRETFGHLVWDQVIPRRSAMIRPAAGPGRQDSRPLQGQARHHQRCRRRPASAGRAERAEGLTWTVIWIPPTTAAPTPAMATASADAPVSPRIRATATQITAVQSCAQARAGLMLAR
jgi:hypothetical protein